MPCPSTSPKIVCAVPNFLCQTKIYLDKKPGIMKSGVDATPLFLQDDMLSNQMNVQIVWIAFVASMQV